MANVVLVANWLSEKGVSEFAQNIKSNYLTGTAITIVVALFILLGSPKRTSGSKATSLVRRCPVCDHVLLSRGDYCSECGSEVKILQN
jgi:rRNA maturation endonuclease Nob1